MLEKNFEQPIPEELKKEVEKPRLEKFKRDKTAIDAKIIDEVTALSDKEVDKELKKRGHIADKKENIGNKKKLLIELRMKRAENIAGLRDKLEEFRHSRQEFVEAEKNLDKYHGLKGISKVFKKDYSDAYNRIRDEYFEKKDNYEEKRAEYMGEKVNRLLNEQAELADSKAQEFNKEKGIGQKFYEGYKKLGKWNLGALLGEKIMSKLDNQEGDNRAIKFLKGTGRFLARTLSLRLGISFGLLGVGLAFGGGVGFAGALIARRSLAGVGAGIGTYDLMKMFGERKETRKGAKKELSKEELKGLELSEITERMSYFEHEAEASGNPKILDDKVYRSLKLEFNTRARENKIEETTHDLALDTERSLDRIAGEEQKKELKRKGIAAAVGLFMASGAFGELLGRGKTFISDLIKGDEATGSVETLPDVDREKELLRELIKRKEQELLTKEPEIKGFEDTTKIITPDTSHHPIIQEPEIKDIPKIPMDITTEGEHPVAEHFDYQGGKSVWREVGNQLKQRRGFKELFSSGDEAEQTHAIDFFKDKIAANPQGYGLSENVDIDKLTSEQLKNVDWDKLLCADANDIDKAFPELSEEAKQNIVENNRLLQEYVGKTGKPLDTDTVDQVLKSIKESGGVDEYLAPKPPQVPLDLGPEPEPLPEELPLELGQMRPEEMNEAQKELFNNYQEYLKTEVRGRAAKAAQESARNFLDKQPPEVYNKYVDLKQAVQRIRVDDLNEELKEGRGLLRFGRPETADLTTGVQKLAETHNLSETETKFFTHWLGGEDGILKKNDFVDLMTDKKLDLDKFGDKIQSFNDAAASKELPSGYAWEPRHIHTGEGSDRIGKLVNMRKVEGGYQMDSKGDGVPDLKLVYKPEAVQEMMKRTIEVESMTHEVTVGEGKVVFYEDQTGRVNRFLIKDYTYSGNPEHLLKDDWDKTMRVWEDGGLIRKKILAQVRVIDVDKNILEEILKNKGAESQEAKIIEEAIKNRIEILEKEYGDIVKDDIVK